MSRDENEFLNKKVVITGASSGIGQAVATYFLNCGATVVLVGRDKKTLEDICTPFKEHSTIIICELTKDIELYDLKSSVIERLGVIDILVNCAGIKFDSDIEKTFPQDFDYSLDINLRSVFILTRGFENFYNENASIVNISCFYGSRPMPGLITCCMTKAGLETFTKCAALEYARSKIKGIRVNCVSACAVYSNSLNYVRVNEAENIMMDEKMKKSIPLGRMAFPDEIARAVIFLCSRRSGSITGQVLKVDGGRSLTSSGYVHYKGYLNMNSRFEPDGETFLKKLDFLGLSDENKDDLDEVRAYGKEELKKFVEKKIRMSNFSTNLSNAHKKVEMTYKNVPDIDDNLRRISTGKKSSGYKG